MRSTVSGFGLASLGFTLSSCSTRKRKPSIIFLLTDDQRSDALSCAGNPLIQTPNMDWLAQNGIRFENAFVTTPICAASRASLLTGLYERKHGYTFTRPPIRKEYCDLSYPVLLRRGGYRTGFVGKFGIKVPEGVEDEWFDYFRPSAYPYFKDIDGKKKHLTDINMDRALDFIRETSPEQHFCLSLSTWAPHAHDSEKQQYFWPSACDDLYRDVVIPTPVLGESSFFESLPEFMKQSMNRDRWFWRFDTPKKHQEMVKGYYRMISGVDMALGRLLNELKRLDRHRDTIIILMSDNGYFLGERGFAGKWTMYDLSIRVPLIIYDPRMAKTRRGTIDSRLVLNVDIAPTILNLAGLSIPQKIQGESLVPNLNGSLVNSRKEILTEHLWDHPEIPQTEAVRTQQWKYIRYPQHPEFEELYDLQNDSIEKNNLVLDKRYSEIRAKLRMSCDHLIQKIS
ncbi:MAG: sulfatase-like hydrolase/transferase [Candidatus Aminicenantes bacterium]|nr:sulfatase-like hydrolase/transferase [Candidatus Aminicenantes bacterium]